MTELYSDTASEAGGSPACMGRLLFNVSNFSLNYSLKYLYFCKSHPHISQQNPTLKRPNDPPSTSILASYLGFRWQKFQLIWHGLPGLLNLGFENYVFSKENDIFVSSKTRIINENVQNYLYVFGAFDVSCYRMKWKVFILFDDDIR